MGVLRRDRDGWTFTLTDNVLIGRGARCLLRVNNLRVSKAHASLVWSREGHSWELRDLGSRNGTRLDGELLEPRVSSTLRPGASISFGDDDDRWSLIDARPPTVVARSMLGKREVVEEGGILLLPDDEEPEATVFLGRDGRWVLETEQGERPLEDGEVVMVAAVPWQLFLPQGQEATWSRQNHQPEVASLSLRFAVSRDEEYVELFAVTDDGEVAVGSASFNYTLLLMARQRLSELELPPSEQGWIDKETLAKMLSVNPRVVNVHIHRARRRLGELGFLNPAGLVERRWGTGQLRLGIDRLRVDAL